MDYEQLFNNIQAYAENTESLFVASIPVFVQEAEERIYNSVNLPSLRKNVTGTMTAGNPYLSLPDDWLSAYSLAVINVAGVYSYLLNKDVSYIREAYPTSAADVTTRGKPQHYALFGSQYSNRNEMSLIVGPTPDQSYQVELHYFFYPPTIVQGQVTSLNTATFNQGSLYTNGVYQNIPLSGGSGQNLTADLVVVNQNITSVSLKFGGQFYIPGDILTVDNTLIGGSGTGFSITVAAISNANGTSWLGDNYDPVLFYGAMREAMLFMKGEQDLISYYETKYQEALQQLRRLSDGLDRGDFYRDGQTKLNTNLKGNI